MKKKIQAKDIQEVFSLSERDSEALLAQITEVPITDPIPMDELNKYVKVDSTTTTLNNLHGENTSAILDRNAPE